MAKKRSSKSKAAPIPPVVHPDAAGIDIGATEIFVAVPVVRDQTPVRGLTFMQDLCALADWLLQCGIRTVAMESTGVYWIPLFQILEARGLKVCLVNAHYAKNVPGRRTDVCDCQWLQYLHTVGLLRASFRPEQDICALRSLLRHREGLVQMGVWSRPAHAKSTGPDEPANSSRHQRYYRPEKKQSRSHWSAVIGRRLCGPSICSPSGSR